ncbi:MAG: hypothetical protein ISS36_00365 [Candidatus Aenigmarchaeota archaeon]|nr:hypothetical protein [Candidatus Aenigmarchaeota archaeon]
MIDFLTSEIAYIMLPFIFILVIIFGGLKVGSPFDRKINLVLAFIVAAFSVTSPVLIEFIHTVLPYAAIFFVVIFILSFFKKSMGGGDKDYTLPAIILAIVMIFVVSQAQKDTIIDLGDTNLLATFVLVFIILILYLAYKRGEK